MKLGLGDIVQLTFLDHCLRSGADELTPMRFEAFGRVIRVSPKYVVLAHFIAPQGPIDADTESVVILRSTIEKVRRLR